MNTATARRWHAFPRTNPARRPTPWWYYGRALYVSRRDHIKIYCALLLREAGVDKAAQVADL